VPITIDAFCLKQANALKREGKIAQDQKNAHTTLTTDACTTRQQGKSK